MSLNIQYCSDLHLEFPENRAFIKDHPLHPKGDILLLAGDIMPFSQMEKHDEFFDEICAKFKTVYWIPGNHEYYHFDAAKKNGVMNERIRENVFLVNNITIEQLDVRFIFSTLWTKISPLYEPHITYGMNDFRVIRYNGGRFSAIEYNRLHRESLNFIRGELNKNYTGKTILVTHHVPTFMNYPEQYKGSLLNEGFAVELFDFIEQSGIDCWIYGHHHCNTSDFVIGSTTMLTNQLGYVRAGEHHLFDPGKTFLL